MILTVSLEQICLEIWAVEARPQSAQAASSRCSPAVSETSWSSASAAKDATFSETLHAAEGTSTSTEATNRAACRSLRLRPSASAESASLPCNPFGYIFVSKQVKTELQSVRV